MKATRRSLLDVQNKIKIAGIITNYCTEKLFIVNNIRIFFVYRTIFPCSIRKLLKENVREKMENNKKWRTIKRIFREALNTLPSTSHVLSREGVRSDTMPS